MKQLRLVMLLALGWAASAGPGDAMPVPPVQVVRDLIVAAGANDLDTFARSLDCGKVAMGPHGRSLGDTVAFLRTIDLGASEVLGTSTTSASAPQQAHVILRTPEFGLRFELELRDRTSVFGRTAYSHREIPVTPRYVVIEIHRHP